ncbi:MAG TPA: GNAT family N-acetyltransferase [Streptosporangiaceae bacterium]
MDALRRADVSPLDLRHHGERWVSQQRQEAVYLLAWDRDRVVGRVTVLLRSRYPQVRSRFAGLAEMNALEARPRGQGTGTALILVGEQVARARAVPTIGLAVEPQNHGARRLYERFGYCLWDHGLVTDRWAQHDEQRNVVKAHADEGLYLTKGLSE